MVAEFSDLQGVMGGYYALNDNENDVVATAISEHYHPRFSGDSLPSTPEGLAVAIADKIDSIVGIYGIGYKPTGSKDPYALKRAGLGLLRMMIEKKLELDLFNLISKSAGLYNFQTDIRDEINNFISERLGAYYQEHGIDKSVVKAVQNKPKSGTNHVYDLHLCIQALHSFMQNENSKSLIEANKRLRNIHKDFENFQGYGYDYTRGEITINDEVVVFTNQFDKNLLDAFIKVEKVKSKNQQDYPSIMQALLNTKPVIDGFFDNVMVLDENLEVREKRMVLTNLVLWSFQSIANFSYLSK